MRYSLVLPAFAVLANALPAPQDIDIDMVLAAPDPTYTQVTGLTAQSISYDATSIAAQATAAASSVSVDSDDVASETIVAKRDITTYTGISPFFATQTAAASNSTINDKRNAVKRAACGAQPKGIAEYSLSSDSAAAFRSNSSFAALASAAPVPSGYVNTFTNAGGANSAYGYLGYYNLPSYDSNVCAAKCSSTLGCMSFNIYFERDPSVDPGTGSSGCENPSSVVYAKCSLWGGPVTTANAVNKGQFRNQFEVAITGSNGYQNNTFSIPAGYALKDVPVTNAINAPYDAQGYNTYMGATIFTKGAFNIQLCADYCTAQTAYNLKHPANDGTPPKTCHFFNTYILYLNNASTPQGQYCALYTETWDSSYATNSGQYRGTDRYFIDWSYTFTNATSAGPAPKIGDQKGAVYQAVGDMKYSPTSLTSTFLPFCSSMLDYTIPIATATALTTITPIATSTTITTSTITGIEIAKRGLSTPAVLTKYPSTVLSSACSLIATKPLSTSTTTALTSTITAPTQTTLVTSISTVIVAPTPTGSTCADLGTSYIAANGKKFSVDCGHYHGLESALTNVLDGLTFRQCADLCADTDGCAVFDFDVGVGCQLAAAGQFQSSATYGYSSGLLVDSSSG